MRRLFRQLFRRRGLDSDVHEEIESHIAMRAELNRQAGMPEHEALHSARKQFGNTTSVREQIYHSNGFGSLDAIGRDLRTGVRTFRRYPGITCLALLSLALGIGANTLAFSFVNVLLFPELPYPGPDRLVIPDDPLTSAECSALRQQTVEVFQDFGCFADSAPSGASIADDRPGSLPPEHLTGQRLSAGAGRALAVTPRLGRWFSEADETGTAKRTIVISHSLWQRRFGGSFDVLDKPVHIDGETATIVGVMPDKFAFLNWSVDYWLPLRSRDFETAERVLGAVARLRPDATVAQAQSILDVVLARRAKAADQKGPQPRVVFTRVDHFARDQFQDTALLLQGAVGFVLLIACANVAGLLLTQTVSQQREMAIRTAIGSGTWRIVRQVLVHSVLLFCAGGLLGLAVGWAGVRFMVNVVLPYASSAYGEPRGGPIPGIAEAGIDGTVLLFTFAIALIFGLVAAIAPALQVSRAQPLDVLRESNQSATPGVARQRVRNVFVTVQIGLAFVLLVSTALMLNGMTRTLNQNIGFDTRNLLTARLLFPTGSDPNAMRSNSERMRQNLEAIPGVLSATGIAIYPPLSGAVAFPIQVDDQVSQDDQAAQFLPILPGYFKTLGTAVIQGQEFSARGTAGNVPVAIVNVAAARQFWPNESALGKRIQIQSGQLPAETPRQVIGVVREVSQYSGQTSRPQLYVPYDQLQLVGDERLRSQLRSMTFIVRTQRPISEVAPAMGEAIGLADRTQATSGIRTMQQTAFAATYRRGVFIALIGLFGIIAVVLALTGVYGVMANVVSHRFSEFGIRMALGAAPVQIRRLVLRQASILIGIGLLLGIVLSLGVTRVLRTFLFGTSPTDPITFVLGAILLGGIALLACYIPAWRASRADAIQALRHY